MRRNKNHEPGGGSVFEKKFRNNYEEHPVKGFTATSMGWGGYVADGFTVTTIKGMQWRGLPELRLEIFEVQCS
jgi:hypothetical protein